MDSNMTAPPRTRRSSHRRENHPAGPDRPLSVKKQHHDRSREQNRHLSDDDDVPSVRGERHRRKKKHPSSSLNPPSSSGIRSGLSTPDPFSERAHKSHKQKRNASRSLSDAPSNVPRTVPRSKRDVSHEGKYPPARTSSVVAPSDDEAASQPIYTGPIAVMEFNKMKKELEVLKKQTTAYNKTIEKQSNTILSLENQLRSMSRAHKEQLSKIEVLKTRTKQSDELASNIEGTLQCQICIDTLTKPFALSPCGHVLCQGCLQDWFRSAPVPQDEMDVDEPLPLVLRKKTCPFCRSIIRSRPLPLFVLKSLLSILSKGKSRDASGSLRPSPPPDLEDPWAEIFPPLRSDSDSDAQDDDDEDYSEDDDDDDDDDGHWGPFDVTYDDDDDDDDDDDEGDGDEGDEEDVDVDVDDDDNERLQEYDNASNDEYEGEWVMPNWEPPIHRNSNSDPLDPDPAIDTLLRRGATRGMIESYEMEYSHDEGLSLSVDDGIVLHIGWNLNLAEDDGDGERFVAWCLEDLEARSYRWTFVDHDHVYRLVRSDALDEYATTDSECWIGIESGEDEGGA